MDKVINSNNPNCTQNLIPMGQRSKQEIEAIHEMGVAKAREAKARAKSIKDVLDVIGSLPAKATDSHAKAVAELVSAGVDVAHINRDMIMHAKAYEHAENGNIGYYKEILDRKEGKAVQKLESVSLNFDVEMSVDGEMAVKSLLGIDDD